MQLGVLQESCEFLMLLTCFSSSPQEDPANGLKIGYWGGSMVFDFHGANVPAMACIKLPVLFHRMVSRLESPTVGYCESILEGSNMLLL